MPKERETSSRGQGGNRARDLSPETRAAGPRDKTRTVPGAAKKAKQSSLREPAQSKRTSESAVNTTRNARGQKSTPHFVRACAVETHFKARICSKYHAKRSRTEVDTSLCASLRSRNAFQHQARARICGKYHAKRSRTEVANSLCASLRSRNALRHQARARICGKYHAKRSRTERAPQSGTKAFSLTVRTS